MSLSPGACGRYWSLPPEVMAAVREQMERFTHTCFQVTLYDSYVELAERLNAWRRSRARPRRRSSPPAPRLHRTLSRLIGKRGATRQGRPR